MVFLEPCSVCGHTCITDVSLGATSAVVLPGKHNKQREVQRNDFNDISWNLKWRRTKMKTWQRMRDSETLSVSI